MAGVGVKRIVRGNGVPCDLWHCAFSLSFYHFGAAIVISSAIAVAMCGIEWEVFAHRVPLVIFVVDLGHGAGYYCLGSSLLRKESGRVFVVPSQIDSFRTGSGYWHIEDYVDLDIWLCMQWHTVSLLLSLPLLGDNNKRPESSNRRLCPGVLTTLLGAN